MPPNKTEVKYECSQCRGEFASADIMEYNCEDGLDYICDDCIGNFMVCGDCGVYIKPGQECNDDCRNIICATCYEDNYFVCDGCERIRYNDDYSCDGLCLYCYEDEICPINRPPDNDFPKFKVTNEATELYFGVELEIGFNNNPHFGSLLSNNPSWVFNTEDGSVDAEYNCEFLIAPMTWKYIESNKGDIEKFISKVKSHGGFSPYSSGMHIHLSKDAFDGYAHIYRFFKMIHNNFDFWYDISGRKDEDEISEWAYFMTLADRKDEDDIYHRIQTINKHSAVNAYHDYTLETRFFASTTYIDKYISNIKILYDLFNFTKNATIEECTIDNFKDYLRN